MGKQTNKRKQSEIKEFSKKAEFLNLADRLGMNSFLCEMGYLLWKWSEPEQLIAGPGSHYSVRNRTHFTTDISISNNIL